MVWFLRVSLAIDFRSVFRNWFDLYHTVNLDEKQPRTISTGATTRLNITELLTQEEDIIELPEPEEENAKKPPEVQPLYLVHMFVCLSPKIGLRFPIVGNKCGYF